MVLVPQLVELGVIKLTIEQIDQGGEARDRRDIHTALLAISGKSDLTYAHMSPAGEPMLWVADTIAWCAGGAWRARIARSCTDKIFGTRETRLQTVRRGTGPTSS